MACCILTAYIVSRLIHTSEWLTQSIAPDHGKSADDVRGNLSTWEPACAGTAGKFSRVYITLRGLTCASCVSIVQETVHALHGVERASVSLALSQAVVVYRGDVISARTLAKATSEKGYEAEIGRRSGEESLRVLQHEDELRHQTAIFKRAASLCILVGVLESLVSYLLLPMAFARDALLASAALGTWIQLVEASSIHRSAWAGYGLKMKFNMDILTSLSLLAGLLLSWWKMLNTVNDQAEVSFMSGSLLTVVVVAGRILDSTLKARALRGVSDLYEAQNSAMSSVILLPGNVRTVLLLGASAYTENAF